MTLTCTILRGLPGSGKSTYAKKIHNAIIVSADDFFMDNGEYKFNPRLLSEAHASCMKKFIDAIVQKRNVVVDNTNVCHWMYENYKTIAEMNGYKVEIVDFSCDTLEMARKFYNRQTHDVPLETFLLMWWNYNK